ncbi:S9 family peptidase [Arsukibacterium sp.]|uniref:S9 family peptidase n=1 Tax=Arsukibacterium sp. TaxID=1977258 RepID=UPI002FD99167
MNAISSRFNTLKAGLLLTGLLLSLGSIAQASETRPITANDLWQATRIGSPVVSPDGKQALFTATRYDVTTDRGNADLYLLDIASGRQTQLTFDEGSESGVQWSPNAQQLAFVARRGNSSNQLFVMNSKGGEARQVTKLPVGVSAPRFTPDGKAIIFMAQVPANFDGDFNALGKTLTEQKNSKVSAKVTENRVYRHWDRWLTDDNFPRLFKLELATEQVSELTPGWACWFNIGGGVDYDIAPDGKTLALSAITSLPPYDELNNDILLLTLDGSGQYTNITADNPASDTNPLFSPDGRYLVYGQRNRSDFYADNVKLIRYDLRTGNRLSLAPELDLSPGNWQFSRDGKTLFFQAGDRAKNSIFALPASGGKVREVLRNQSNSGLAVAANNQLLVVQDGISQFPELFKLQTNGRNLTQLTQFNRELQQSIAWGKVEEVSYTGADSKAIQMYVIYPPNFDASKKWPLLNLLHGGPHGFFGDGFSFRWNPQAFAAPGYVTIMPNFHGSTSFGQEFALSIHGEHPTKPFIDSEAAVDYMLARGFIDENRLAAAGGSYGGYLVSWIAGHTDRYKALINHAGVYNLMGQFASDGTSHRVHAYGGAPWDGLETMLQWSPAMHADKFVTPMLVIHGELDYRVPATQGLEVYGVYKGKGLDARLVYFPNENHWILKPNNSLFWFSEFQGWLERFLGAGTSD